MADNDRLILHTVHGDEGWTELYFGRSNIDHGDFPAQCEGSILFHKDGSFTYKCFTDDDTPVVVSVKGNRIAVVATEDQDVQDSLVRFGAMFDSRDLESL